MKTLIDYVKSSSIREVQGEPINMEWIDNSKPVMTKDGRTAVVTDVDLSEIPNKIIGQVKLADNNLHNYTWDEYGKCLTATDTHGNPKKPDNADDLVKAS